MNSIFAKRMETLGTETAFEVFARAKALEKQGKDIVHLEIGEPDFDTPKNIKEAATKALNAGYTHYGPSAGIPEFREVIAQYISKTRGINAKPDEVVVTPGAKPIMFYSIFALVNPGDEVLYPNPGFPIYESLINFVDAKPVPIPLLEENDFRLDPEYVKSKITKKTKLIILNYPENPTGGILTKEDLKVIADCIASRDDVFVLADEIYSRILYEGKHEALKGPQVEAEKMVSEFKKRREVIVTGLNDIKGIACKKPRGAFYVFPNIKGTGMDCRKLGDHLLYNAGVAVLPGTSFGKYGEDHLRLSFANSIENIKKALDRIAKAVEKR
jgi:aspartate/methionine/tyrosine aminotransferase